MKKISRFRLCALGLGIGFFTYSNAILYFKLDELTILRDEDDCFSHISSINNPTNILGFDLLNSVKGAMSFTWDDKKFTVFNLKNPSIYFNIIACSDVKSLPLQFIECVSNIQFIQEFFSMNINIINSKIADDDLQKTIENLKKIHKILKNQANNNSSYMKIIKKMTEANNEGRILLDNINITPDPQREDAYIINFVIPERAAFMSDNEYIQSLKNLKKERKKLLNAFKFFPNINE